MNQLYESVGLFFLLTNSIALILMWIDKERSRGSGVERISEGMLFFLATFFGSVGVLIGMYLFRHKTRKWYFVIGIPLLIVENLATLYGIFVWLG